MLLFLGRGTGHQNHELQQLSGLEPPWQVRKIDCVPTRGLQQPNSFTCAWKLKGKNGQHFVLVPKAKRQQKPKPEEWTAFCPVLHLSTKTLRKPCCILLSAPPPRSLSCGAWGAGFLTCPSPRAP